jgi:DNA-binding NtrC family response regulator
MAEILIVDDDAAICLFFSRLLEQMGCASWVANSVREARGLFAGRRFDLVLLDLDLPDGIGLDLLPEFAAAPQAPEVIIVTGTGDARGAELAFKYGAWDYVQKPFLLDEVSLPITRALQYRREKLETRNRVPLVRSGIIGESEAITKCLIEVGKAAASDAGVLVTGETGTGKELVARAIHANSRRASKPFVAVDCGALPENLLESTLFGHEKGAFTGAAARREGLLVQAEGGTLMLDEVGELPLTAQRSLLRTLQERRVRPIGSNREIPVDFRLIAATNLNLERMVRENRFRQDLLFRIRAMEITLPPLRERRQDIEEIVIKKLHELSARYAMPNKAVSQEFFKVLTAHAWPGNVRELINVLEYVLASAAGDPTLYPKHLPPEYRLSGLAFEQGPLPEESAFRDLAGSGELPTLLEYREKLERTYLRELLNRVGSDRKEACRLSGLSQSRLYDLLKKHDLPGFGSL